MEVLVQALEQRQLEWAVRSVVQSKDSDTLRVSDLTEDWFGGGCGLRRGELAGKKLKSMHIIYISSENLRPLSWSR